MWVRVWGLCMCVSGVWWYCESRVESGDLPLPWWEESSCLTQLTTNPLGSSIGKAWERTLGWVCVCGHTEIQLQHPIRKVLIYVRLQCVSVCGVTRRPSTSDWPFFCHWLMLASSWLHLKLLELLLKYCSGIVLVIALLFLCIPVHTELIVIIHCFCFILLFVCYW